MHTFYGLTSVILLYIIHFNAEHDEICMYLCIRSPIQITCTLYSVVYCIMDLSSTWAHEKKSVYYAHLWKANMLIQYERKEHMSFAHRMCACDRILYGKKKKKTIIFEYIYSTSMYSYCITVFLWHLIAVRADMRAVCVCVFVREYICVLNSHWNEAHYRWRHLVNPQKQTLFCSLFSFCFALVLIDFGIRWYFYVCSICSRNCILCALCVLCIRTHTDIDIDIFLFNISFKSRHSICVMNANWHFDFLFSHFNTKWRFSHRLLPPYRMV